MHTILITPITDHFKHQINLLWYAAQQNNHNNITIGLIPINQPNDTPKQPTNWPKGPNYKTIKSAYTINPTLKHLNHSITLNIQIGLQQLIENIDNNQTLQILETDIIHLTPPTKTITDGIITDNIYEPWHLHSLTTNNHIPTLILGPHTPTYTGGFLPIITQTKTLKKLLPYWINHHIKLLHQPLTNDQKWWAGMYSLQTATQKLQIPMYNQNTCYIPPINTIKNKQTAHYSVDTIYNKKHIPWNLKQTPNNKYYNLINQYLTKY